MELNRGIPYSMMGVDLSSRWLDLVESDKVSVSTTIPEDDEDDDSESIGVRYGVRVHPRRTDDKASSFMEFVESVDGTNSHPRIAKMNETLQVAAELREPSSEDRGGSAEGSLQFRYDGYFVAQLQLVRTLRPPPSPGFGQSTDDFKTSSTPPPYVAGTDSFVTGDLRLQLRPLVAKLTGSAFLSTPWDVYHNISPADVRGHFLLIPEIADQERNWRGQALVESDCQDLVQLASKITPTGNMLVCFNSVGAGASQNHIHCHLWPSPPVPLLHLNSDAGMPEGWNCYAASRAPCLETIEILSEKKVVTQASLLDYPCACVKLSTAVSSTAASCDSYVATANVLWKVLQVIGDAPYNVCMVSKPSLNNEHDDVDAYIFIRSRERSPNVISASKAGASEMMGVFHCQSIEQLRELEAADDESPMARLLRDVSHPEPQRIWELVKDHCALLR